jgi:hypothetical protein
MSKYIDTANILEPQVNQYGRNMVMTNVQREMKRKYINIDTKFRDEYNSSSLTNYTITLPERITNVQSIMVCTAEIPLTYYNISANLGNNHFTIVYGGLGQTVIIPDGQYTSSTLASAINVQIQTLSDANYKTLIYSLSANNSTFHCSSGSVVVHFDMDSTGTFDKYNFKSKLGWLLGFRKQSYTITTSLSLSECLIDLNGPRYLYLVIDEFSQNNTNSFISPQAGFLMNKNILARITINSTTFPNGAILPANNFNGYLLTDRRNYNGIIDIKKFNVQLVNDIGKVMDLNGMDFSFCLEVTQD